MDAGVDHEAPIKTSRIRYGFDTMLRALTQYGQTYGHCNVPRRYCCALPEGFCSPDGAPLEVAQLGAWLSTQRYEKRLGKLHKEREDVLQKLVDEGLLSWEPLNSQDASDKMWPEMFKCLVDYLDEQRRIRPGCEIKVSERTKHAGPNGRELELGRWMHTQMKRKRNNSIRPDRLAQLQGLVDCGKLTWPKSKQRATPSCAIPREDSNIDDSNSSAGQLSLSSSSSNRNTENHGQHRTMDTETDNQRHGNHSNQRQSNNAGKRRKIG